MKRTIEKIVAFAVQTADPEQIILFGSMGRGTDNVHSDLDLLIVTRDDVENKQISGRVEQFAQELALKADILVYSRALFKQAVEKPHSFLAAIWHDGKIIYKKA